jgi:DNA-binding NarL/FixJ family response regulator
VLSEETGVPSAVVGALRVMVIDDHELVREGLVSLMIHDFELPIDIVYSGDAVTGHRGVEADVVLLDVDLGPRAEDVRVNVKALMSAGHNVLLISANEDSYAIRRGVQEGALGFIPKRVGPQVLVTALQTVAAGEMFLSVDLAAILANAKDRPDLSRREIDTLRLYAAGLTLTAVAHRMDISPHTAKEYLDRVRRKYELMGRAARTRTELYVVASHDGILESE